MPRFVILEHDWNGIHYDLMLEQDGILRTWSLPRMIADGRTIPARALPDHRSAYLDYEGPVSGDRGRVRRVCGGEFDWLERDDHQIEVELRGDQLNGRLVLWRTETGEVGRDEEWSVRFGNRD